MSEKYRAAALFACALSKWDLPIFVLESTGKNMATQFYRRRHSTVQTRLSPPFENEWIDSCVPHHRFSHCTTSSSACSLLIWK